MSPVRSSLIRTETFVTEQMLKNVFPKRTHAIKNACGQTRVKAENKRRKEEEGLENVWAKQQQERVEHGKLE